MVSRYIYSAHHEAVWQLGDADCVLLLGGLDVAVHRADAGLGPALHLGDVSAGLLQPGDHLLFQIVWLLLGFLFARFYWQE